MISKWAQNLLVVSSCGYYLLSCGVACPVSASEHTGFILLPCKTKFLDSSTLSPMFNLCQDYVLLGIVGNSVTLALWLWSYTWHYFSFSLIDCDQNQSMQLVLCTGVKIPSAKLSAVLWSINLIYLLKSCLLILQFVLSSYIFEVEWKYTHHIGSS